MREYVTLSLETHLFFARIMKEHALFLLAAFPAGETAYRNRADWFREQFENALAETVRLANGMVSGEVLNSGEVVTEFTENAERQTQELTMIPIDVCLTREEKRLSPGCPYDPAGRIVQQIRCLNRKILRLLNGLIAFKEQILREVLSCRIYTANYPLLIEHIIREAQMYRQIVTALEENGRMPTEELWEMEMFWDRIMMEHAMFIRGMLDPQECKLMETADRFADDYCRLLEAAEERDCRMRENVRQKTTETTESYRDFKEAGVKGITGCKIRSVILPLLADHVLREANHYLRILEKEETTAAGCGCRR